MPASSLAARVISRSPAACPYIIAGTSATSFMRIVASSWTGSQNVPTTTTRPPVRQRRIDSASEPEEPTASTTTS